MNLLHIPTPYLPDIINSAITISSQQNASPPSGLCMTRLPSKTCHAFTMSSNVSFPFNVGIEDTRPMCVCVCQTKMFSVGHRVIANNTFVEYMCHKKCSPKFCRNTSLIQVRCKKKYAETRYTFKIHVRCWTILKYEHLFLRHFRLSPR